MWWDLAPEWCSFMLHQRWSASSAMSLELRFIQHASTWLLTSLGSLVTNSVLKRMPSSSPGGSRASMVSISWVGLLSQSSPPLMSLRHVSADLGVRRTQKPGLQIHVGAVQVVDGTQYTVDLLYHLLR